ncbi:porin family protein [Flavobacterium sp.]|uniref:porin family protein n=1 Tax=Flavobacterium sp. TaxID=239 RepID=UPI002487A55B|nr:porin family protein [Flavobacterium sp.]MDI1316333.1 porin family protein [Flavobacterium sp.]
MRVYLFIITFFTALGTFAQQQEIDFDAVDSLYREDQFYLNITYNALQKRPFGINQNKLSPGIAFGFLRDMPINKKRTFALAAGLGCSVSVYNQNLRITEEAGTYSYQVPDENTSFVKNKLSLYTIDLPVEFRWRNSTPESHIFWRVYTGFKFSYVFYDLYKSEGSAGTVAISNNKDVNQFQYGAYVAAGWNTWNFYIYYGLNPLFKSSAKIDNQSIDMNTANFGLMFYIL